jgi:hypothetical protein
MLNLTYCTQETKDKVNQVMESPSVAGFTKEIIKEGLNKDCLDAVDYVELALDMLKRVQNDII